MNAEGKRRVTSRSMKNLLSYLTTSKSDQNLNRRYKKLAYYWKLSRYRRSGATDDTISFCTGR